MGPSGINLPFHCDLWFSGCLVRGERPALTADLAGLKVYCRFLHVYRIRGTLVLNVKKTGTTKKSHTFGGRKCRIPHQILDLL